MPYRVRLFQGDRLLVAIDGTLEEVGQRAGKYPTDDLDDGSGAVSIRREVVYIDESGNERPATESELDAASKASTPRVCRRCGRQPQEHDGALLPCMETDGGVVYWICLTPKERAQHSRLGPG